MANTTEAVKRLLLAYPYNSEIKIAGFILRHRSELLAIAPGEGASNHEAVYEKLHELIKQAEQCLTIELSTQQELPL
ncbi:MAG TPA: hypothetical protein VMW01_16500 [Williamwhitmania sp.]|nr:hypothetical protein [Williamwhitmania sp.]